MKQNKNLNNLVFGPITTLKRAYAKKEDLEKPVGDFLKSLKQDYYGHHRAPKFNNDDDAVIQLLYGRMHVEDICDELGFTVSQIEARANQLGMITSGKEYNEEHIAIVRNMINNGCNYEEVCDVLEIPKPQTFYTSTKEETEEMKENAQIYIEANRIDINQTELLLEENNQ